jgi:hypothetical protein
VLDVVARYGTRGEAEEALQLHGPGTLHVHVAREAAAVERSASATFDRWRGEVLTSARAVGPTGQVTSARRAVPRP